MHRWLKREVWWMGLIAVLLIGLILAAGDGGSNWLAGWLAYTLLLALVIGILYITWRLVIGARFERSLLFAVVIAFLLRLWLGSALTQLLPTIGYAESEEHQAGYAFTDARIRDQQAWDLAGSERPLKAAFSGKLSGDQYGGMLALSALVYRYLSPDAHRQMLILVLTAAAAAWGVIFVRQASQAWFGRKVALASAWIFALYPESVLLGSSQMREAFVLSALAMTFYSLTLIPGGAKPLGIASTESQGRSSVDGTIQPCFAWIGWLLLAGVILFLFQPPVALIAFAIFFVLWLLEPARRHSWSRPHMLALTLFLVLLLLIAFLVVASIWTNLPSLSGEGPLGIISAWLQKNFEFQSHLTERASGMFQKLLDTAGEQWKWLIVLVYGIAQPVLPAVVGDPNAAWIMRVIGFFRAAGWYALAPFLVYGTLVVWRAKQETRRVQLIFLSLAIWAWVVIAALNGGADQWDTPRYRTILLAWEALLAAWAWVWARAHRDAWLWRWLAVEAVFVLLFTEWYASRYYPGLPHLDIFVMIPLTLVLCAGILLWGWWKDRRKAKSRL